MTTFRLKVNFLSVAAVYNISNASVQLRNIIPFTIAVFTLSYTLDTVNPAMGMMLCSSMLAFEKVYFLIGKYTISGNISHNAIE